MILHVNETLKSCVLPNSVIEDCTYILRQHSVLYSIDNKQLIIPTQKITLTELDMNVIFFEVFCFFETQLKYGGLGGHGCDFSVELIRATYID